MPDDVLQRLAGCTAGDHGIEVPLGSPLIGSGYGNVIREVPFRKSSEGIPQ